MIHLELSKKEYLRKADQAYSIFDWIRAQRLRSKYGTLKSAGLSCRLSKARHNNGTAALALKDRV